MKSIQEWYAGRSILVTGGTGFMGKVLLEKMLRSIPGIKTIYILVRPKRGLNPIERIEAMTKIPLFEILLRNNPEVLKKLVPIEAELSAENLGISDKDRKHLIEEVSVVFHMAATLRLEADVKDAIHYNTLGSLRLFQLCEQFKKLESIVHLSTAFCNCDIEVLEEKVYKPTKDVYETIKLVQSLSREQIREIESSLMKPHPNSYIFSKRLAEVIANDMGKTLPISISRPSIVLPTMREPFPGWVDSLNGPIGVLVASGKGVLRTMMCDANCHAEVCSVDLAINALILIAWTRAIKKFQETPVYNITSSNIIKMNWGEVLKRGKRVAYEYPFEWTLWYPDGNITSNRFVHNLTIVLCHYLPAYFIDFLLLIFMQKRFMVRVQNKITLGLHLLEFFTLRKWNFTNHNVLSLENNLTPKDLEIFTVHSLKIDVDQYFRDMYLGARVYCVKEDLKSLPFCRVYLKFLYCLSWITELLGLYGIIWAVLYLFGVTHVLSVGSWTRSNN